MKLQDIKQNVIKGFIVKEMLDESVYPTLEMVCAKLLSNYSDIPVTEALISDSDFIKNHEPASVERFSKIFSNTDIDLETLYRFTQYLQEYLESHRQSALSKLSSLEYSLLKLKKEAEGLLMYNEDVNSGTGVINIDLHSRESVDFEKTDAVVYLKEGYAAAKTTSGSAYGYLNNNLQSILITTLTKNYLSSQNDLGSPPENMFSGGSVPWIHRTVMPQGYSGYVELSVKVLLKDKITFSKLKYSADDNLNYSLSLLARVNGIFKTISENNSFTGSAELSFSAVSCDYLILNIKTREHYSVTSEGKTYKFSCQSVAVGNPEYDDKSVLETAEFTSDKQFSEVSIVTEDLKPVGCSVDYSVSWITQKNPDVWSAYYGLTPVKNNKIDQSNFLSVLENIEATISRESIDFSKSHPYIFNQNICTSCSLSNVDYLSTLKPKIIRNLGGFNNVSPASNIAEVILYAADIVELDFSLYPGLLDNVKADSKTILAKGVYNFRFNYSTTPLEYSEFLSISDLYFGSHLAEYRNPELFLNSEDNDYKALSFIPVGGDYYALIKSLGPEVILPEGKTWQDEEMLFVRQNILSQSLAGLPDKIKLKAVLTAAKTASPIIRNIKIKLR